MSFRISGLNFRYKAKDRIDILKNVNLEIPSAAITAVLGMSGSGKSTLLGLLGLLLDAKQNARGISYGDRAYDRLSGADQDSLRRKYFGFVLQSSYLLPNFTCRYNLQLPLLLQGVAARERQERMEVLLDQIDSSKELHGHLDKRPAGISVGQRQRFAVLRAIIHDPEVVFADEPSASLDPVNAAAIRNLLLRWQRGELSRQATGADARSTPKRTLLLVTHDLPLARRIADYFVVLKKGAVVGDRLLLPGELPDSLDA